MVQKSQYHARGYALFIQLNHVVLLDKSANQSTIDKIAVELSKRNTVINDLHIWKIATSHQAAIIKISSVNPLASDEYKLILKELLPQLIHVSIEIKTT